MRSCNWTAWLQRFSLRLRVSPAGDLSAIMPYLKALDRLDRYQVVASANQVYDDEARKKLIDKINRLAENLGIDENFAAAVQEHLKKTGQIPADEPGEAEGQDADLVGSPDLMAEANAPEGDPLGRLRRGPDFFYSKRP
jgi:hypothetical protein